MLRNIRMLELDEIYRFWIGFKNILSHWKGLSVIRQRQRKFTLNA
jgi:hypothetical protein